MIWSAYEIQGDPWLVRAVNTKNGKTDIARADITILY